jgi:putative colanic acid biosynthesis UDP-glucose lipid carrier transferase
MGDLLVLNLCFLLGNWLSYGVAFPANQLLFLGLINALWLSLLVIMRPYQISRLTQIITVLRIQFNLLVLHLLMTVAVCFFVPVIAVDEKVFIGAFYLFLFVLSLPSKVGLVFIIRRYRSLGYNYRKIAIVGYGKLSKELGSFLQQHPEYGYQLEGYFDNDQENDQVLGKFDQIEAYSLANEIDELYCCMPIVESKLAYRLVDFGEENLITIKLITDFHEFSFKRMELEKYGGFPVINITSSPLDDFWNKLSKRIFDMLFSLFVLVFILTWLAPIIAILIKLDSRGRVFFIQKRTGIINKTFNCYKFRTMRKVGESATEGEIMETTKIGAVLRKYGIDELPQFLNVLIGDMSVIGPRPHRLRHTEEYKKLTDKFMFRHSIKPGITGLAQVKGYKGEIDSVQVIRNRVILDRFYIENWSLPFDIKIALLTVSDLFINNRRKENTNVVKNRAV